jgi:hypothetical protein
MLKHKFGSHVITAPPMAATALMQSITKKTIVMFCGLIVMTIRRVPDSPESPKRRWLPL